ncbi:polyprenol reductase [Venturia canescens]|uniref:polyprenol reductase n=1 Tax=Venturia canescens TaxID=32260 RepID=UPI001C9C2C23|nr:polyprenol reductase [Venturia canescens]XP_043266908.1 polyprenol reductase [Venturia canescens]
MNINYIFYTMNINFTRITFLLMAVVTGGIGILINFIEKYLPVFLTRTYRYGKFPVATEHPLVSKLEVPKRWFKHYYEFAAPTATFVLVMTIYRYILEYPSPGFLNAILDLQLGSGRKALVSPESTLLAVILINVQCWKRLYESHYISIFSEAKMNIVHYFAGFIHYLGLMTCAIGESQGFAPGSTSVLRWDRLTNLQYVCAFVFLLASYEQLKTNHILANLRKDKAGNVVTKSHKIPRGRLFEFISAPLQFTEIIMYTMLAIILWRSSTYHYVYAWVLANQFEFAFLTHRWYTEKFKDYPKQRMVVIPRVF